jgi:hypothetical protein
MPRKHTRKINIRGGGEETPIQKQIREELERILCIFTLDKSVRKDYTVSSFSDNTSNGAQLIVALRDLYSSKSIKFSTKARNRNELIVRIIKLLIDEPKMLLEVDPNSGGYQHKYRTPIILPPDIPASDVIFLPSITVPLYILNFLGQCAGNLCNVFRGITDEDAYTALHDITRTIGFTQAGQTLFERYNVLKEFFDYNTNVSNEEYNVIAGKLLKKIVPYVRLERNNNRIPMNQHEVNRYLRHTSDWNTSYIAYLIKKNKLLYFISDLNYELARWNIVIEYDYTYITKCLNAFEEVKDSKKVTNSEHVGYEGKEVKDGYEGKEVKDGDEGEEVKDGDAGEEVKGSEEVHSMGGANLRHRKKTIKKQRRHNRSNLLFKKK